MEEAGAARFPSDTQSEIVEAHMPPIALPSTPSCPKTCVSPASAKPACGASGVEDGMKTLLFDTFLMTDSQTRVQHEVEATTR